MFARCCDPAFGGGDDGFHQQDNIRAGGWRLEAGMWDCDIAVACVEKTQSE